MLKLLKYDLRRRRERILVFIVIALLVQPAIWISSTKVNEQLISLNLVIYFILALALVFIAVFSYFRNLKSYQRRLIPVTALQTVMSPLLFALLLILTVIALGLVHFGIYQLIYPLDFLPDNIVSVGLRCLLQFMWSVGFMMIMVMFSITVALSFRFKGRVWIGIVILTLLQNGIAYLEKFMFNSYFIGLDNTFNFEIYENNLRPDSGVTIRYLSTNQWPLLFEFVVAIILIYSMVVMVKKELKFDRVGSCPVHMSIQRESKADDVSLAFIFVQITVTIPEPFCCGSRSPVPAAAVLPRLPADQVLPRTGTVQGRTSSPSGHFLHTEASLPPAGNV